MGFNSAFKGLRVVWCTHQWSDWVYFCVWMIQYDFVWKMQQVSCICKLLPFLLELFIFYLDILSQRIHFLTRCVWYNCVESTNFVVFMTLNVQDEYQAWPSTGILKPLDCWRWRQLFSFITLGTDYPVSHYYIPKEPWVQPQCHENLKPFTS